MAGTLMMQVDASNPQFDVTLPANPTTGYQWAVTQYDKTLFQMTGSQYFAPQTKRMGAGGQMIFTFRLNKGKNYPQKTNLLFTYARSWEPKSGTQKPVIITFYKNK